MTQPRNEREAHYVLHSTFPREIFTTRSQRRRQSSWFYWAVVLASIAGSIAWVCFSAA